MDLLATLGLGTALPEQSTRLASHPGIVNVLNSSEDDGDVRLGFNRCLNCGKKFQLVDTSSNSDDDVGDDGNGADEDERGIAVRCKGCKRVKYCSASCRKIDAQPSRSTIEELACGHSPVVCSLLSLCNDDEDAEVDMFEHNSRDNTSKPKNNGSNNSKKRKKEGKNYDAAKYRVQTELESYPATLFNIMSEGPNWYIEAMTRRLRCNQDVRSPEPPRKKQRRGKRDRNSLSPVKDQQDAEIGQGRKRELVIHVVGASVDSELWNWDGSNNSKREDDVLNAYAEASTNLQGYLQNLLEISSISLKCIFIGPDCPSSSQTTQLSIPDSKSTIAIETHRCNYGASNQPYLPAPDAIVFFNPGFSCTDYEWGAALDAACAYQQQSANVSGSMGTTPFLITTNTEMEGYADIKYLLDGGYIDSKSLPADILEAVDYGNDATADEEDDESKAFFFSENPYAGLRIRQSGTMGNDLYVKNRWIVGGLLSKQSGGGKKSAPAAKRKAEQFAGDKETKSGSGEKKRSKKRHHSSHGSGEGKNSKRKNPALI